MSISITSLTSSGEGVGSDKGLKVFVEGALPGEEVVVELVEKRANYARGRLVRLIAASPERVSPPCPIFGECGGCQIMHLSYEAQLENKRKRVEEALKRISHLDIEVPACLPSPSPFHYRNKIQLPVEKHKIGMYRKNSHEIVPLKQCLIQQHLGEKILSFILEAPERELLRHLLIRTAFFTQEAQVILVTSQAPTPLLKSFAENMRRAFPYLKGVVHNLNAREDNVVLSTTFHTLSGEPFIYEKLLGKTFKISPAAFFQVNSEQTEHLYKTALTYADIQPQERVLDGFCGVGTLAICAADLAREVEGIECVPMAIKDAKENARLNQITNCHFLCGRTEERLSSSEKFDTVFLNPPRKGCAELLLKTLLLSLPQKIVYISCDPATLARDLALLTTSYTLARVQPIDMFPQTMHVETVALLIKK